MKYHLFNETDQILAAQDAFSTKEKALAYADKLRQHFVAQGYYLTATGARIKPEEVRFGILPAE